MDRLTIKPGICANASTDYCESQEDCYLCLHGKEMRFRLSAYEDTSMTPSEILDMKEMFHAYRHICAGVTPERIRELVEADREGRCVVLPCKVGSKVYVLYTMWETEICEEEFTTDMISSFGKYVFLTREEAEKALEVTNGT